MLWTKERADCRSTLSENTEGKGEAMKYRWYDLPEKELLELLHTDKERMW